MGRSLIDKILGQPVRRIPSENRVLYLTFDDGPAVGCTEAVLEILEQQQAQATFFVIAQKAEKNPELLKRIQKNGHKIGNHSLDHRYSKFFQGRTALMEWIKQSEDMISTQIGQPTVGFRPPAGIRTPELAWAVRKLQMPLILWDMRFFDTARLWTQEKVIQSQDHLQNGTIILLHDRQKPHFADVFMKSLTLFIQSARQNGFEFHSLNRELCMSALTGDKNFDPL